MGVCVPIMPDHLPPLAGLSLHVAPTDMLAPNQGVTKLKPKKRMTLTPQTVVAQDPERFAQFQTPIAVLMLGHAEGGPPHLATWYKWATETGRAGTKVYINHKATGWAIPAEYTGVIVRLPFPEYELRDTAWGRASLVQAELNLLAYAFSDGTPFSHFVLVSEDAVPLRRADTFSRDIALHPDVSRVVRMGSDQDGIQLEGMKTARDQWQQAHQNDPAARNWWVQEYERVAAQLVTHSQWLALCRRDAALCVQNLGTLRTMAQDYDRLSGVGPDDPRGGTVCPDEIVIGTFLNMRGIPPSTGVLMAQSQDVTGFHAEAHATVAALRAAAGQSSDDAMFGRKLRARLQGNDVVTWV